MLPLDRQNEWRELYRLSHPDWQPATERFAQLVQMHLAADATVLDIGCGRGGLVEQLNHPISHMLGIDPDFNSLVEHRLPIPRAVGLSDALPFAPQSVDVAFASWVLEHLERPLLTLQSIHRILKPGGVFIFITPNGKHPLALLNNLLGRMGRLQGRLVDTVYGRSHTDTFPTYYRANQLKTLHQLGTASGLHLIQLYTIPDPSYLAFTPALFQLMSWFEQALPEKRRLHLVGVFQRNK